MKNQQGVTIVEVLISALVLGFMLIGLNRLQVSNRWQLVYNDSKMVAMNQAQNVLDSLQKIGVGVLVDDTTTFACNKVLLAEKTYNLSCAVFAEPLGVTTDLEGDTTQVYSRRVNVSVAFSINGRDHSVKLNGVVE